MSITFKRVLAYLFDIMIVSLVASMISNTTINPNYEAILTIEEEYKEKNKEFEDKINGLNDSDEEETQNLAREIQSYLIDHIWKYNRCLIFENILTLVLLFLYFVVFAYYFGGETMGKRILRLKIVNKDDEKVTFTRLLIRMIVLQGVPITIISMVLPYIVDKNIFFKASTIVNVLSFILMIVIVITTYNGKENRGLHDKLAKTKVISSERK